MELYLINFFCMFFFLNKFKHSFCRTDKSERRGKINEITMSPLILRLESHYAGDDSHLNLNEVHFREMNH